MAGSSGIPSFETMRRVAQFSDIQRLLRKDPSIRGDLMNGLAKKVPQLYEAIKGREEDFIQSLSSNRCVPCSVVAVHEGWVDRSAGGSLPLPPLSLLPCPLSRPRLLHHHYHHNHDHGHDLNHHLFAFARALLHACLAAGRHAHRPHIARHIGSTLEPDEYVVVSKKTKQALDYAVQEGKLITYRWVNTPNQKWTYTTEGTFELKQLPPNQMSVLDVWADIRGGVEHNGVMTFSKHGNANQRWVVTQHGHIISLTQTSRNEVLLLTMGGDGVVTVAPPDARDPESQQWAILPTSRIPK